MFTYKFFWFYKQLVSGKLSAASRVTCGFPDYNLSSTGKYPPVNSKSSGTGLSINLVISRFVPVRELKFSSAKLFKYTNAVKYQYAL